MLLPMLKAASSMLVHPSGQISQERVACAKIIIDELVKFYETDENPKPVFKEKLGEKPAVQPKANLEPKPTVALESEKEYLVTVDENKGLKILGAPDNLGVELDGVKMEYKVARGKQFKKARIL